MIAKAWRALMGQDEPQAEDVVHEVSQTPAPEPVRLDPASELTSLMSAARKQIVDLQVESEKATARARLDLETLVTRMASLEPMVEKSVKTSGERETTLARITAAQTETQRQLADARKEVAHYRPLALRLEDEQRADRNQIADLLRRESELEAKIDKAQRTIDDQFLKIATTDGIAQRTAEENVVLAQKNHEKDFTIEALSRESSALKSDIVSHLSDLERQAAEIADLTRSLSAERDGANRVQAAMASLEAEHERLKKEASLQQRDFEARERKLGETLALRDWQIYDFEIKANAANAKIEALTRSNERQRADILRHLDHIGKLEASSRHLLETLSRNAATTEAEQPEPPRKAKLRAVSED